MSEHKRNVILTKNFCFVIIKIQEYPFLLGGNKMCNLKRFICNSIDTNICTTFDMKKALERAKKEVEERESLRQKLKEMDLVSCYRNAFWTD